MELVTDPTVIALDPGETTGWSVMCVHPEALVDPEVPILANFTHRANGQVGAVPIMPNPSAKPKVRQLSEAERRAVRTILNDVIWLWPGATIVTEDFILRKKTMDRALLSPVRLTAAIEWAVDDSGIPYEMFRQTPAEAKTGATDDRLKAWGLYARAGAQRHARDADRHAIMFLRKAKQSGSVRGLAWPHLYNADGSLKALVAA